MGGEKLNDRTIPSAASSENPNKNSISIEHQVACFSYSRGSIQDAERSPLQTEDLGGLTESQGRDSLHEELEALRKDRENLKKSNRESQKLIRQLSEQNNAFLGYSNDVDKENQNLRQENQHLHNEYNKVLGYWNTTRKTLLQPYMNSRKSEFPAEEIIHVPDLNAKILQEANEAGPLRQRVGVLQQELLSSVERSQAITDEQLAKEFRNLASMIKSLSRKASSDSLEHIGDMFNSYILLQGVSNTLWTSRSRRKSKIEAAIWSVLLSRVFGNPYLIFRHICDDLTKIWKGMFDSNYYLSWPSPTEASEIWRYTTVECLIQKSGIESSETWYQRSEHGDARIHASIWEAANRTYLDLDQTLSLVLLNTHADQIKRILDKAFKLAIMIHTQRCRIQVIYPNVGQSYLAGISTDLITIPECEDLRNGSVSFTVNPGLAKWGDAHGKNLDQKLDLVPALVCLKEHCDQKMGSHGST